MVSDPMVVVRANDVMGSDPMVVVRADDVMVSDPMVVDPMVVVRADDVMGSDPLLGGLAAGGYCPRSQSSGSTAAPRERRISKCRCGGRSGSVTPTVPMICPFATFAPLATFAPASDPYTE